MRLMHPFMPFITEELWQKVAPLLQKQQATVMLQRYPAAAELEADATTLPEIAWLKTFVIGIRRIRAERDLAPGRHLSVQIKGGSPVEKSWLERNLPFIRVLARVESIRETDSEPEDAAVALAGEMTLLVPLAELIDFDGETARLARELEKLNKDQQRVAQKLNNRNFVERAPQKVVSKEQDKLQEITDAIEKLKVQYERINKLKE